MRAESIPAFTNAERQAVRGAEIRMVAGAAGDVAIAAEDRVIKQ